MNESALEQRIAQLEKTVEGLLTLIGSFGDLNTVELRNEKLDDAKVMAIFSFVQELVEREGISSQEFLKHYEIRHRWWHDYYLRKYEEISPSLAAELDTRAIADCEVEDSYPPLFDSPPPNKT